MKVPAVGCSNSTASVPSACATRILDVCGVEPVGMGVLTKAIRLPSGENVGLLAVASAMISRGVVAPGASTYIPGEAPLIRAKAIRPSGDTAGS